MKTSNLRDILIPFCLICVLAASAPSAQAQNFDANNPAASGYALSLDDSFTKPNDIDQAATGDPGYNWYTKQFFGYKSTKPAVVSIVGGVLTFTGGDANNGAIETACPADNAQGYVGQVFGAGAYFEASIAFDPARVNTKNGWPAFWSMGIEHMANKGAAHWPGQPANFDHFAEDDFFEYDTAWAGASTYGGAVHDWWGIWTPANGYSNLNNDNYVIKTPDGTDFRQFHRYGNLWTPASASNGWRGSIQYFFDGAPTSDTITWTGNQFPGAPPPSGSFQFSIMDEDHMNVLLGCGDGQEMRVKYVRVWQIPSAPSFTAVAAVDPPSAPPGTAVHVTVNVSCTSGWINPASALIQLRTADNVSAAAQTWMPGRPYQGTQTQMYTWATVAPAKPGDYHIYVDMMNGAASTGYYHGENLATLAVSEPLGQQ